MSGTYNSSLATLSFAIAVIASYIALGLAGRVKPALGRVRLFWLLGGAVAMGTGIWSMHFIAMLAFHLPLAVNYDVWLTLLSLLCSIVASGIALFLLSRPGSGRSVCTGRWRLHGNCHCLDALHRHGSDATPSKDRV
jgi:NO-binding membrane sensor protein with MHYT domain